MEILFCSGLSWRRKFFGNIFFKTQKGWDLLGCGVRGGETELKLLLIWRLELLELCVGMQECG